MNSRPMSVDDEDAGAVPGLDHGGAAAGRAGREVRRAHEPRLALDEDERLALVQGMVAERHGVGAGHQDLVADRLGDAEAAGGVLAVDDDAIEPPALAQRRQPRSITALRPGRPTMSPRKRRRIL